MEVRHRSMKDLYQRRFHRNKEKHVERPPFRIAIRGKTANCRLQPLKLTILVVLFANFLALLYSPSICHNNRSSHAVPLTYFVSRWILGASDPRYVSHLETDWNEVGQVIDTAFEINKAEGVGLLNFNKHEINHWKQLIPNAEHAVLHLDPVQKNVTWDSLYPEWIDEEQEEEVPICPDLPKLEVPRKRFDLIAVKLPCKGDENWTRDIARLHLQLAAAGLAAASKSYHNVHLLFVTSCFPIPNLFTCKELILRQGNVWLYQPNLNVLREKMQLPVGSCELALPFKPKESGYWGNEHREAYATILHSADVYVCGAITAAQSIRMSGSTRDLVILVDETISGYHRSGLEAAGWKVREIQRIRNPKAEKDAYNEWNYSKFRLWQLTDYDKIIFFDADMLILKNIDFLFSMPEISATGNDATLFNSGVMVIEPSNCTYQLLLDHIDQIESYNGGDQGYLNEIFTWWHRIPRHMNFLKHFWDMDDEDEKEKKTANFGAEPPVLFVLHYLGQKPWLCFRDYDCNWNVEMLQEFASDVAHWRWWKVHDSMSELLQQFCLLRTTQKAQLQWERMQAEKGNYTDGHWQIKIQDKRLKRCIDNYCSWKNMLRHWGDKNSSADQKGPFTLPRRGLP
ncbi:UDP-glucuronate:xylan alpha-glucuronosyltransferase 1-like [Diospyros lotus]|uniref:UDP-glucuronate:xylan alpha-glucuronosyltransferase 1-like n=1 Tax=Diospyros lotus TaxID=55363 RepID=UPI00225A0628|nr:UDP-glucuronate:xylan alpha-glucuronosyltransferase 1-like [Diospyros lotus]XP_052195120.1 UDP-glucuronate:xylan alpha-glucuronosyltransferase 1-like [Diospyros lotus]XP_052195121.1 UDP-glucuronate:xylan alpha-glucuronosyltransferase 1-like [Diospyros lotus]